VYTLADIVARLRAPDGCPWDIEQTHETLRPFLLEETYEVLDAIDGGDPLQLAEELGDLLLQVVLHAQIAAEAGDFRLSEVVCGIAAKIVRRHPHVFGDVVAKTADDVRRNWEALKADERAAGVKSGGSKRADLPLRMPALARAQALYVRESRRKGDGWGAGPAAVPPGGQGSPQPGRVDLDDPAAAIGSALWRLVEEAQRAGVDAESALREHMARVEAGREPDSGPRAGG
jgi:tetrapyrrole methylase family protein/MazG family protein